MQDVVLHWQIFRELKFGGIIMADAKAPKSAKSQQPEQNPKASPTAAKRPAKAAIAKAGSAVKPEAGTEKSAPSRVKTKAESLQPPEATAKRRVKAETTTAKPSRKAAIGSTEPVTSVAVAPPQAAEPPDPQEMYRMIAEAAYYLAEKRNFEPGWEQEDWETARKDVMAQLARG